MFAILNKIANLTLKNVKGNIVKIQERNTSFFTKTKAQQLWKGVVSVSNAGKKRGRGKGTSRIPIKNLNRGQIIGVGKINMLWPGLSGPVIRGRELIEQQRLPDDPDRESNLIKLRNEYGRFRQLQLSPLDRGWSGSRLPGRKFGPPEKLNDEDFEGFESIIVEFKSVFNVTGNLGRKRRMSAFVVTGNGNGLAGFGLGKAVSGQTAATTAKNRAGQKLLIIPRHNNHTVLHDFFTQFGKTKIYVEQKPEGYGLRCHRVIRAICEMAGIKDLYAKVEGSIIPQHIVKAFFLGLVMQKDHQKFADESKLHLVELREENDYYPNILASPTKCLEEVKEYPDFKQLVLNGKVRHKKKKKDKFYTKHPGWVIHLKKTERYRNQDKVKIKLLTEYGRQQSFLAEKYPECVFGFKQKQEETTSA